MFLYCIAPNCCACYSIRLLLETANTMKSNLVAILAASLALLTAPLATAQQEDEFLPPEQAFQEVGQSGVNCRPISKAQTAMARPSGIEPLSPP